MAVNELLEKLTTPDHTTALRTTTNAKQRRNRMPKAIWDAISRQPRTYLGQQETLIQALFVHQVPPLGRVLHQAWHRLHPVDTKGVVEKLGSSWPLLDRLHWRSVTTGLGRYSCDSCRPRGAS